MKHLTFIVLTLVLATGCSKKPSAEDIVGNWKLEKTSDPYFDNDFQRLVFFPEGDFLNPDDLYNEIDTEGGWSLNSNSISVNYDEGTGTIYKVQKFSDSTLTLVEDAGIPFPITYEFKRLPFKQPKKDTLRHGTYFKDLGIDELPLFEITDANTTNRMFAVTDSGEYFIWIKPTNLQEYQVDADVIRNGLLKKTLVRNQFELLVNKTDSTEVLEIELTFDFKKDSIFILHRNWVDESKTSYNDIVVPYEGRNILQFKIKKSR